MHVKTPETIEAVSKMYINGVSHDDIARCINISDETLRKYYSDDMQNAWSMAVMKAGDRLYEIGMRGDAKSLLAWLTHRGKWSAHKQPEAKNELTQALLEKIIDKL